MMPYQKLGMLIPYSPNKAPMLSTAEFGLDPASTPNGMAIAVPISRAKAANSTVAGRRTRIKSPTGWA